MTDIEHPDITRTRLTGYPDKEKKPTTMGDCETTQHNHNTNEFISLYESERSYGKNQLEAYTLASGELAFAHNSDMDLLQELYSHYLQDRVDDFVTNMEESE